MCAHASHTHVTHSHTHGFVKSSLGCTVNVHMYMCILYITANGVFLCSSVHFPRALFLPYRWVVDCISQSHSDVIILVKIRISHTCHTQSHTWVCKVAAGLRCKCTYVHVYMHDCKWVFPLFLCPFPKIPIPALQVGS